MATMPNRTYLKFDPPIPGGSRDEKHKDEMEILSWQHGFSQSMGGAASSEGGPVGRAKHQLLHLTKMADGSMPELLKAMDGGDPLKKAILSCYRANGKKSHLYLKVELENVRIANFDFSAGGDSLPVESFALDYGAVTYTYTPLKPDGSPAGNKAVKMDLQTGKIT